MGGLKTAYSNYGSAIGDRQQLEIAGENVCSAAKQPHVSRTGSLEHPAALPTSTRWCLSDPEIKLRRRVSGYKTYAVERKVKASLRKGLRWIKGKCSEIVHDR